MLRAVTVRYLGGLTPFWEGYYMLYAGDRVLVEPGTEAPGGPYLHINPSGGPLLPLRPWEYDQRRACAFPATR